MTVRQVGEKTEYKVNRIQTRERNSVAVKTVVKRTTLKKQKFGFQDHLSLNAGQEYCRMLQGEHSAILSTFIMQPFVIKIFVLSIFEWPFLHRFYRVFL